jgi:hypothetical protein
MPKHFTQISPCALVIAAISVVPPASAQQSRDGIGTIVRAECGGQDECVEDRPLSAAEAERSIAHPAHRPSVESTVAHRGDAAELAAPAAVARARSSSLR